MEVLQGKRYYQLVVANFLNSVFPYFSVHFLYNHQYRDIILHYKPGVRLFNYPMQ